MVNEEVVEGVMRSALTSISKKDKISLQELRIKMELNESQNSVNCFVLKGKEYVSDLSWTRILGMKVVFSSIIIETIKNMLFRLSKENDIEPKEITSHISNFILRYSNEKSKIHTFEKDENKKSKN